MHCYILDEKAQTQRQGGKNRVGDPASERITRGKREGLGLACSLVMSFSVEHLVPAGCTQTLTTPGAGHWNYLPQLTGEERESQRGRVCCPKLLDSGRARI